MDRLEHGFAVFGVDDRRLGQVVRLHSCCFEVSTAAKVLHLVPGAIFNVDRRRVTWFVPTRKWGATFVPSIRRRACSGVLFGVVLPAPGPPWAGVPGPCDDSERDRAGAAGSHVSGLPTHWLWRFTPMRDDLCLRPGLRVQTYNRRPVGVIQQVEDDRLLLRSPWRRVFWISSGLVRSVDDAHATLHIDSRVVDRYRQPVRLPAGRFRRQARVARLPLMCGGLAGIVVALVALL